LRFGERRNPAVALDHFRAGVVSGERKRQIAAETLEEFLQVARAGINILRGVESVGDGKAHRGARQQLHEAERPLTRDGARIEIRFDGNDVPDQFFVHAVLFGGGANQNSEWAGGWRFLRIGGEDVFAFDGKDGIGGNFDHAAVNRQAHAVAGGFIAGDVEAQSGAQDGVIGAGGRRHKSGKRCDHQCRAFHLFSPRA